MQNLDDSISLFAPTALNDIQRGLAGAKDSMEYYEYLLRLANFYWLSDRPERADTLINRIINFVNRQDNGYYAQHNIYSTPRLNTMMASALSCKAARNHNFHRDPGKTLQFYKESYRLYQHSDNEKELPFVCANIADAYIQLNDIPNAARCYRRALFLVDSLKQPEHSNITLYMGLAQIYLTLNDFETAKHYYDETERFFDLMLPPMQAYYVNNLGNYYYFRKDYHKALDTFLRLKRVIIKNGMQNNFDMYLCKVNLADVYLNLNQTDSAQHYLDEVEPFFRKNGDPAGIYYCNTIRIGIATKRGDFNEVRRVANGDKDGEKDVQYSMVNIRNRYMRQFYEHTNNYRMAYETLKRDQSYTDSLEHNSSNMRSAEIMARFRADTLQLHHDLALEHKNAEIQRAHTMTTGAILTAVVLVLLLIMWYMHTRKKQLQNQVNIMNLKLNNVRNRISPHFMFNVLNNKIVNSGEKEASELMEVARLIRTNLDMSSQPYMMLDKELEFVQQYIRVERYLLGDDFKFNIDVADDADIAKVKIPSMFLQILTENAIVHGLKGMEGEKRLRIYIARENNLTIISVEDNGPGFNARRALKKGTGLGIISQTIAVTNERNKQKMRFEISNREDSNNQIIGCKATLKIPDCITF
uniref:tetratricopeptide repeat-containing sensor histidine kinase n=1 Tax=Leyella stercorea TaxID=363265 RepID=UPI003FEFDBFC